MQCCWNKYLFWEIFLFISTICSPMVTVLYQKDLYSINVVLESLWTPSICLVYSYSPTRRRPGHLFLDHGPGQLNPEKQQKMDGRINILPILVPRLHTAELNLGLYQNTLILPLPTPTHIHAHAHTDIHTAILNQYVFQRAAVVAWMWINSHTF